MDNIKWEAFLVQLNQLTTTELVWGVSIIMDETVEECLDSNHMVLLMSPEILLTLITATKVTTTPIA